MEETIIDDSNLSDFRDQDLAGLKAILDSEEFNITTTPEPIQTQELIYYKICKCGAIIYKYHKTEYRCGQCGSILFESKSKKED